MVKRKSKKPVARKVKRRTAARKTARAAPRKAKGGYDIHPGQPTGREVQAMNRLQVLTERYISEGPQKSCSIFFAPRPLNNNSQSGHYS